MMTRLLRSSSMVLILLVLLSVMALAQSRRGAERGADKGTLSKETFMDMESVGNPSISPDGRQIVFSRSWVDKVKDERVSNLWIVDVEGTRPRELTSGTWRDSAPVWSPDGKRIAFLSDRDGTNQLHVLWVDTREVAQLTHLDQAPAESIGRPTASRSPSLLLKPTTTRFSQSGCPRNRAMRSGPNLP